MLKKRVLKTVSVLAVLVLVISIFYTQTDIFGTSVNAASDDPSVVSGKVMRITKKRNATTEDMINGYNSFSLRTLKEVLAEAKDGENVMISPASLMFALDMAASGAQGKTYKQMAALIFKGATKRDLVSFAYKYRKALEKSGVVNIANSIWINDNNLKENKVAVNEEYLNFLRKYFKAATDSLEFNAEAKDRINGWISEKTKGMIKEALDKLEDSSIMLIINALSFDAEWEEEYYEDQVDENGEFTNSEGEKETVKMLFSNEDYYLSSDTAQGFLKYYKGGKYAFMAMLPNDADISLNDYIAGLSDTALKDFYNSCTIADVVTKMPAFTFDYSITLNDVLKRMGMQEAFNFSANFLKMLDPETVNPDLVLYIGSVIQKTHIELDEKGTKAAAVTIIDMKCETTAYEPEIEVRRVILDRPFIFAIMDTETGTPVFVGTVNTVG